MINQAAEVPGPPPQGRQEQGRVGKQVVQAPGEEPGRDQGGKPPGALEHHPHPCSLPSPGRPANRRRSLEVFGEAFL